MQIPHNALVALANGEKFVVMRNTGLPFDPRLERIADLDLELTNFSAGVRHQDPAGQRNGSTDIDELAHGAAIAHWLNGQALDGTLVEVVIAADPNASSGMSTDTALKAKPGLQTGAAVSDTGGVSATSDTGGVSTTDTTATGKKHHKKGAGGYQYHGASSDSALHAKPGTQTGKTARDSTSMKPDSSR